jgi:hypothetical protein
LDAGSRSKHGSRRLSASSYRATPLIPIAEKADYQKHHFFFHFQSGHFVWIQKGPQLSSQSDDMDWAIRGRRKRNISVKEEEFEQKSAEMKDGYLLVALIF